jgi:hypothetical protein
MSKPVEINIERAQKLKADGWSYNRIGEIFGTTGQTIRVRIDPEYGAMRLQRSAEIKKANRGFAIKDVLPSERRAPVEDVAARLAEIPQDTRTQGQRLMGDPLPGRSALDRRAVSS